MIVFLSALVLFCSHRNPDTADAISDLTTVRMRSLLTKRPGVMLTVDITSLSDGIHHLEFSPSAEEAALDPSTFRDIHVEAELQCHRDRILVKIWATATAELTCDRTLQPYEEDVEGQYSLLFGPPSMVGQEGEEFEEVRPFLPSDREIDLTDVVRDTLLLALPQRQIAPGAEEEPIDQEFGTPDEEEEEPIDPRWEELQKLKNDNSAGENS